MVRKVFTVVIPDTLLNPVAGIKGFGPALPHGYNPKNPLAEHEHDNDDDKINDIFSLSLVDGSLTKDKVSDEKKLKEMIKELNSNSNSTVQKVKDFTFYDIDFGTLTDEVRISMRADQIMFMTKRYARSNDSRLMVRLQDTWNDNLRKRKNRIKFSQHDDFKDKLSFVCFEDPKDKDYRVTLTYEFFPKIVYNVNFHATCSKYQSLLVKQGKVIVDGVELQPSNAPQGETKRLTVRFR